MLGVTVPKKTSVNVTILNSANGNAYTVIQEKKLCCREEAARCFVSVSS